MSNQQFETAGSERERLLLIKISELQARLVIFNLIEHLWMPLIYARESWSNSLSLLCRMNSLTDELTAEKLKYVQVS